MDVESKKRKLDSMLRSSPHDVVADPVTETGPVTIDTEMSDPPVRAFTDVELEACVKVLNCLSKDMENYKSDKQYRMIRKAIIPFTTAFEEGLYNGASGKNDYNYLKQKRLEKQARQHRKVELDRDKMNKRKLRSDRIDKLKALEGDSLPLIPDGAVETEDHIARSNRKLLITDDIASSSAAAAVAAGAVTTTADDDADPEESEDLLNNPKFCYICKTPFFKLHEFYSLLCPPCACFNFERRHQTRDLSGKVALLTGARVKIGYHCGLKLLRAGATVIATSRFPQDCAMRYGEESDSADWSHRLHVIGIDFRDIKRLEAFCDMMYEKFDRLDIIVNNACQTVRRPPAYYSHLLKGEMADPASKPTQVRGMLRLASAFETATSGHAAGGLKHGIADDVSLEPSILAPSSLEEPSSSAPPLLSPALSKDSPSTGYAAASVVTSQMHVLPADSDATAAAVSFPKEFLDVNAQQVDLRKVNSWNLLLGQVESGELAEVFAINAMSPFIINGKLRNLMCTPACAGEDRFIVNVSAMEGKFYRHKGPQHPHTNMAKAALNMMTRTSAQDYAKSRIFMNSVDTGWINDENPLETASRIAKTMNFQTPIDEIDAASRILDLVMRVEVDGSSGTPPFGKFYKDYKESEW